MRARRPADGGPFVDDPDVSRRRLSDADDGAGHRRDRAGDRALRPHDLLSARRGPAPGDLGDAAPARTGTNDPDRRHGLCRGSIHGRCTCPRRAWARTERTARARPSGPGRSSPRSIGTSATSACASTPRSTSLTVVLPYPVTGGGHRRRRRAARLRPARGERRQGRARAVFQLNALIFSPAMRRSRSAGSPTPSSQTANPELVKTMSVKPPRGAGGACAPPSSAIGDIDLQPCGGTHVKSTGGDRDGSRHRHPEEGQARIAGCVSRSPERRSMLSRTTTEERPMTDTPFVTPEWLAERLVAPGLVVVRRLPLLPLHDGPGRRRGVPRGAHSRRDPASTSTPCATRAPTCRTCCRRRRFFAAKVGAMWHRRRHADRRLRRGGPVSAAPRVVAGRFKTSARATYRILGRLSPPGA